MKYDDLLQELATARKAFLEVLVSACFGTILGVYFTFFGLCAKQGWIQQNSQSWTTDSATLIKGWNMWSFSTA